jgi:hypothetical protein
MKDDLEPQVTIKTLLVELIALYLSKGLKKSIKALGLG